MLSHNWLQTERPTNQLTDELLELLEWLFATKNKDKFMKFIACLFIQHHVATHVNVLISPFSQLWQ